jgi:asparagine synthase (glutamine-hydrolysing)
MPGHILTINLNQPNNTECIIKRWWWPDIKERWKGSFDEAALRLRELFLKNIRLHLRSDVPVGAALSGGIDSSAVVCGIRAVEPDIPIHTFSYIANNSSVNEEKWVDIINKYVGADSHKIYVNPSEIANNLDELIRYQGEPFGSSSIYAQYCVFGLAKDCGITVTLDGQGADELLGGYNGYPYARIRSLFEEMEITQLFKFLNNWSKWPGRSRLEGLKFFGRGVLPESFFEIYKSRVKHRFEPSWLKMELFKDMGISYCQENIFPGEKCSGRRLMQTLRSSLTLSGLTSLLRHGDRNSMCFGIESRVPFLTSEMAEFLLGLPEEYLVSAKGETKSIFRRAMKDIVPDEVLMRKDKIGFETPEKEWLLLMADEIRGWLNDSHDIDFLNHTEMLRSFDAVLDGKMPFSFQVWRWINFVRWYQYNF